MLLCCVLLCNLLLTQGNLAHLKGLPRHTFTSREEQRGRSFLSEREELRKSSREALPEVSRGPGGGEERPLGASEKTYVKAKPRGSGR